MVSAHDVRAKLLLSVIAMNDNEVSSRRHPRHLHFL